MTQNSALFAHHAFFLSHQLGDELRSQLRDIINIHGGCLCQKPSDLPDNCSLVHVLGHGSGEHENIVVRGVEAIRASPQWVFACNREESLLEPLSHTLFRPLTCPIPLAGFDSLRLCLSLYAGLERRCLRNLCSVLGAKYSDALTRRVTHVICPVAGGEKFAMAQRLGIPCVTADWLEACVQACGILLCDDFFPPPPAEPFSCLATQCNNTQVSLGVTPSRSTTSHRGTASTSSDQVSPSANTCNAAVTRDEPNAATVGSGAPTLIASKNAVAMPPPPAARAAQQVVCSADVRDAKAEGNDRDARTSGKKKRVPHASGAPTSSKKKAQDDDQRGLNCRQQMQQLSNQKQGRQQQQQHEVAGPSDLSRQGDSEATRGNRAGENGNLGVETVEGDLASAIEVFISSTAWAGGTADENSNVVFQTPMNRPPRRSGGEGYSQANTDGRGKGRKGACEGRERRSDSSGSRGVNRVGLATASHGKKRIGEQGETRGGSKRGRQPCDADVSGGSALQERDDPCVVLDTEKETGGGLGMAWDAHESLSLMLTQPLCEAIVYEEDDEACRRQLLARVRHAAVREGGASALQGRSGATSSLCGGSGGSGDADGLLRAAEETAHLLVDSQ